MTYIGTLGLRDHINERAYTSIIRLLQSGLHVIYMTPDGKEAAQYIAESTAIIEKTAVYHPFTILSADSFRNRVGGLV